MAKAKPTEDNLAAKISADQDIDEVIAEQITDAEVQEVIEEKHEANAEKVAKAGKRSAKSLSEAETLAAKEERKLQAAETEIQDSDKPRQHQNPTRSRLERQGKKFREASAKVDKEKLYGLADAMKLVIETSLVKFDATIELHVNLNVDPRHADQNIRDTIILPHGTGKPVRVAVFADIEDADKAKAEGADITGIDDITKLLEKGVTDFDTLIATPTQMSKLGKYARILGPRGLMPNPKSGTVTTDVVKAVKEAKAGRVEYRVDSAGVIHMGVGKASFGADKLEQNVSIALNSIKGNKPTSVKSNFILTSYVASSMGPSVRIDPSTTI